MPGRKSEWGRNIGCCRCRSSRLGRCCPGRPGLARSRPWSRRACRPSSCGPPRKRTRGVLRGPVAPVLQAKPSTERLGLLVSFFVCSFCSSRLSSLCALQPYGSGPLWPDQSARIGDCAVFPTTRPCACDKGTPTAPSAQSRPYCGKNGKKEMGKWRRYLWTDLCKRGWLLLAKRPAWRYSFSGYESKGLAPSFRKMRVCWTWCPGRPSG